MKNPQNRIILALDVPNEKQADALLSRWDEGERPFIKVGYQLFFSAGPKWVEKRKKEGYSIFLDLKLHDIPNTVAKGIQSLSRLGIDFLTIHASGGTKMMEKAREAAEKNANGSHRMKLLAVTQLTSTDQTMLNHELRIRGNISDSVQNMASLAYQVGMDGAICSGREAQLVKKVTGPGFLVVTPGIRPERSPDHDQKRKVTPREAVLNGADYLVVGRPVTQAPDPKKAFQELVDEIG